MHSSGLSWISGRLRHPQQRVEVEEAFKKILRRREAPSSFRYFILQR